MVKKPVVSPSSTSVANCCMIKVREVDHSRKRWDNEARRRALAVKTRTTYSISKPGLSKRARRMKIEPLKGLIALMERVCKEKSRQSEVGMIIMGGRSER